MTRFIHVTKGKKATRRDSEPEPVRPVLLATPAADSAEDILDLIDEALDA